MLKLGLSYKVSRNPRSLKQVHFFLDNYTGGVTKDERRREGTFISFGDSLSNRFLRSLSTGPYRDLCDSIFTSCRPVYHWVYDMQGYWGDGVKSPREPPPDNVDYQHQHVLSDIKKVSSHGPLRPSCSLYQSSMAIPDFQLFQIVYHE